MMNERQYTINTLEGHQLIIKVNRSNIQWELDVSEGYKGRDDSIKLTFSEDAFRELYDVMDDESQKVWKGVNKKYADSDGCDYWEYYGRVLDNNGYLTFVDDTGMRVGYVYLAKSKRIYQFNKQKVGTFLYDFELELGLRTHNK